MKFSIKDCVVTFTEEILNGKLHFLCSESRKLCLHTRSERPITLQRFSNPLGPLLITLLPRILLLLIS